MRLASPLSLQLELMQQQQTPPKQECLYSASQKSPDSERELMDTVPDVSLMDTETQK